MSNGNQQKNQSNQDEPEYTIEDFAEGLRDACQYVLTQGDKNFDNNDYVEKYYNCKNFGKLQSAKESRYIYSLFNTTFENTNVESCDKLVIDTQTNRPIEGLTLQQVLYTYKLATEKRKQGDRFATSYTTRYPLHESLIFLGALLYQAVNNDDPIDDENDPNYAYMQQKPAIIDGILAKIKKSFLVTDRERSQKITNFFQDNYRFIKDLTYLPKTFDSYIKNIEKPEITSKTLRKSYSKAIKKKDKGIYKETICKDEIKEIKILKSELNKKTTDYDETNLHKRLANIAVFEHLFKGLVNLIKLQTEVDRLLNPAKPVNTNTNNTSLKKHMEDNITTMISKAKTEVTDLENKISDGGDLGKNQEKAVSDEIQSLTANIKKLTEEIGDRENIDKLSKEYTGSLTAQIDEQALVIKSLIVKKHECSKLKRQTQNDENTSQNDENTQLKKECSNFEENDVEKAESKKDKLKQTKKDKEKQRTQYISERAILSEKLDSINNQRPAIKEQIENKNNSITKMENILTKFRDFSGSLETEKLNTILENVNKKIAYTIGRIEFEFDKGYPSRTSSEGNNQYYYNKALNKF